MILRNLQIHHFKNIDQATLSFSDKVNCFLGANGVGKTNILDALHYLSFTRSHLGVNDALVIQRNKDYSVLRGHYIDKYEDELELLLQIRRGQRKTLKKNKKEYAKLSEHIGLFPLVIVSPQDYQLIQGASEERRKFVDLQLSQQDTYYLNSLSRYQTLLEQRNSLLKSGGTRDSLLDVLDVQLSHLASYIWEQRCSFLEKFNPIFRDYYAAIAREVDELELRYRSSLNSSAGDMYNLLLETRGKDHLLGYTSEGVHRDDLEMLLGGEPIRKVGSEGQRKTFLISLKLAQYRLLSKACAEPPMLLLDDIFDKLDEQRVKSIIELVGGQDFGQIFITDTNRNHLEEIIQNWGQDYHLFTVNLEGIHQE